MAKKTKRGFNVLPHGYWERPKNQKQGDSTPAPVYLNVGIALTTWEKLESNATMLLRILAQSKDVHSIMVIERLYGSIATSAGRRESLTAAAEIYFGPYWKETFVSAPFKSLIENLRMASGRRDDIAHGMVHGFNIDGKDLGWFLLPPEYNNSRSNAFFNRPDADDPMALFRCKFRYTSTDVKVWTDKFARLSYVLTEYYTKLGSSDDLPKIVARWREEQS